MSAINQTTCPKCHGRAHWNTDDGITYCDAGCGYMDVENPNYQPPWHRGGSDFGGKP